MGTVFTLALYICHFVGDYYLQTSKMAANKIDDYGYTLGHSLLYTVPFGILCVLWGGAPWVLGAVAVAAGSHFLIDMAKCAWTRKKGKANGKALYIADQLLHLGILLICGNVAAGRGVEGAASNLVLLAILYGLILIQPAYITYKVLVSKKATVETLRGKSNYIYKIVALLMGILIFSRRWILVGTIGCAGLIWIWFQKGQWREEALRMYLFIQGFDLAVFGLINLI